MSLSPLTADDWGKINSKIFSGSSNIKSVKQVVSHLKNPGKVMPHPRHL